jgi:hypothetical protein
MSTAGGIKFQKEEEPKGKRLSVSSTIHKIIFIPQLREIKMNLRFVNLNAIGKRLKQAFYVLINKNCLIITSWDYGQQEDRERAKDTG